MSAATGTTCYLPPFAATVQALAVLEKAAKKAEAQMAREREQQEAAEAALLAAKLAAPWGAGAAVALAERRLEKKHVEVGAIAV